MKRLVAIFLVAIVLAPLSSQMIILIDFKVNEEFIADVLCVNKNNPMTICGGSCYLKKQLDKTNTCENEGVEQQSLDIQLFFDVTTYVFLVQFYELIPDRSFGFTEIHWFRSIIQDVFHPPQLT